MGNALPPFDIMPELAPTEFALIAVMTREAYSNKHIYQILIDRLIGLEHMLVSRGFEGPISRIQFHLRILKELQRTPRIADDQILWSLVEATELADIYCTLPKLEWRLLKREIRHSLTATSPIKNVRQILMCLAPTATRPISNPIDLTTKTSDRNIQDLALIDFPCEHC
jgi:hypothetical protein